MVIIATKHSDSGTLILELNNPPGNSFTKDLFDGLSHWLSSSENDPTIRSIIITGVGKIFSVGGDIHAMQAGIDRNTPTAYVEEIVPLINKTILQIVEHKLPIIAAINGSAAGGGLSLALACDHRISIENTKFAMAFGKIGLTPDSGSSLLFPLRFGQSLSMKGIALGDIVSAEKALKIGAIDLLVKEDELIDKSKELAGKYKLMNQWTVSQTKRLINTPMIQLLKIQLQEEFELIKKACSQASFPMMLKQMIQEMQK